MKKQYLEIKAQHPDCLLFFRLGDFYEMFDEDAKVAAEELNLTLTTRDRNKPPEERTPMCGVPYHSAEAYIARLIAKGYKVAICEQTEDVPYLHFEYRLRDQETGEVRWSQASMLPLQRDGSGVVTSVLLSVQDVTDVKEREIANRNALEDAFREAERASRAKTDFLNSMSHDIRTPMNSIMGLTAIASMYLDDPERVKDCLTKITTSSRHLLGLINEVLDMAKIESGNLGLSEEDFDLPETVESLMSIMTPQINDKKLNLKVEIADIQHEHVVGDPMRLQQVFVNSMGNSVKFTPEGGTVSLRIKELPSRVKGSGCYEFTFSDTGCGMSEEFVQKVFEPFTRANDSRVTKVEGTGLGMSIVRSVVNLMNGTIDVKSKLGEGTTFTVTVYMKYEAARRRRSGSDAFGGLAGAGGRRRADRRRKRVRGAEIHRDGARLRVVRR